jgi:hypothetical protein
MKRKVSASRSGDFYRPGVLAFFVSGYVKDVCASAKRTDLSSMQE